MKEHYMYQEKVQDKRIRKLKTPGKIAEGHFHILKAEQGLRQIMQGKKLWEEKEEARVKAAGSRVACEKRRSAKKEIEEKTSEGNEEGEEKPVFPHLQYYQRKLERREKEKRRAEREKLRAERSKLGTLKRKKQEVSSKDRKTSKDRNSKDRKEDRKASKAKDRKASKDRGVCSKARKLLTESGKFQSATSTNGSLRCQAPGCRRRKAECPYVRSTGEAYCSPCRENFFKVSQVLGPVGEGETFF